MPSGNGCTFISKKFSRSPLSASRSPPHARMILLPFGSSSIAYNTCSSVTNSCLRRSASLNAVASVSFSSCVYSISIHRLDRHFERELVLSSQRRRLRRLRLSDLSGENAGHSDPIRMNVHHDAERLRFGMVKNCHQDRHHELHGRVVVVVEEHFVHARSLRGLFSLLLDLGASARFGGHGSRTGCDYTRSAVAEPTNVVDPFT